MSAKRSLLSYLCATGSYKNKCILAIQSYYLRFIQVTFLLEAAKGLLVGSSWCDIRNQGVQEELVGWPFFAQSDLDPVNSDL